jgi:hypothetical protein
LPSSTSTSMSPTTLPQARGSIDTSAAAGSSKQTAPHQLTANSNAVGSPEAMHGEQVAPAASNAMLKLQTGTTTATPQQHQAQVGPADNAGTPQQHEPKQQQTTPEAVQVQQGRLQPASPSAAAPSTGDITVHRDSGEGAALAGGSAVPTPPPASEQATGTAAAPMAEAKPKYQQEVALSSSIGASSSSGQAQPRPVHLVPSAASGALHLVQVVAAKRAATAAAAAAVQDAAGQPVHAVYTAAVKAAAAAVEAVSGVPFVTASSIVAEAAAAALGLLQEPAAAAGSTAAPPGLALDPSAAAGSTGDSSVRASNSQAVIPPGIAAAAGSKTSTAQASSSQGKPASKKSRQPECVVCMDARACVRTEPCKHLVLCRGCAEQVASSKGKGECPMCRAIVEQYVVVPRTVRS